MNFPAPVADTSLGSPIAETLVRHLPGPALMATRHAGGPIPARELARAVRATFVGSRSAELALILREAPGDGPLRADDAVRRLRPDQVHGHTATGARRAGWCR